MEPSRSEVISLFLVAACIVGACAVVGPPQVVIGSCTLRVIADSGGKMQHLDQSPYVVTLPSRQDEIKFGPSGIMFEGSGWHNVDVSVADPAGVVRAAKERVDGIDIDTGGRGWGVDTPGMWRFRLEDAGVGCVQEFSVEVRAAAVA